MSDMNDRTIALKVRLKPSESAAHPRATNYTNVAVAQGIAHVDFGFIEPTLLAAIAMTAKVGRRHQKDWTARLSPAWRWVSMCWPACSSRFSKCWSPCARRGSRNRRPNPEKGRE
jgi:hypothetical protein